MGLAQHRSQLSAAGPATPRSALPCSALLKSAWCGRLPQVVAITEEGDEDEGEGAAAAAAEAAAAAAPPPEEEPLSPQQLMEQLASDSLEHLAHGDP